MVQPFIAFAAAHEGLQDLSPPEVAAMDLDARLPLRLAQESLSVAADRLQDPSLGLKLGQLLCFGSGGVFDYAVRSAATVHDSLDVATRFGALLASPFSVTIETRGRQCLIRIDDEIPWPRANADFAVSAWYRTHASDELPRGAHTEIWFPYATPSDTTLHERAFAGAALRFNAPCLGVAFDKRYENAPMPVSDPVVHAMMCARADALLADLKQVGSLTLAVRRLIGQALQDGEVPTVEKVARRIHMSHRTVSRRLEQEGTNFATELDSARRDLAVTLVRQSSLPLSDVAFRVGFSHSESFFRAFRRWTGATPQSYRTSV
jgi:AraC-like DNA-binding protein